MNLKRIVYIALFLLFTVGAIVAIYFVFFKPPATPGPTGNQNVNGGSLPSTNVNVNRPTGNTNGSIPTSNTNGGVTTTNVSVSDTANGGVTRVSTIVTDTVGSVAENDATGKLRYYNQDDGLFYEVNPDGTDRRQLASQLFPEVENVTWSNDTNKAVLEFPDNTNIVYDFVNNKQYTLPENTEDYSFDPTGNGLAYKYVPENVEERYIVTSNIDGTGIKFIEPIGDQAANVDVNWSPQGDIVATFRKGVDSGSQEVFFIGQNKENFKSAVTEGRGFTGTWSPSGEQMLYSVYSSTSNYNPQLYIMNAAGETIGSGRTDLGLQTWPDKCTFSGTNVYCAEPNFLSPGSGLYPDQASSSTDTFYQVDILRGTTTVLADPNIPVNAKNLYISADGTRLYFTNTRTGRIESIRLP